MKKQKGVTLIALMVTVIILLVLAAIAISTVNDGEIIGKAENEYNSVENLASKYNELLKGEGDFLNETYNGVNGIEHTCVLEETILNNPTCEVAGSAQIECKICGNKVTYSIDPLGHNMKTTSTTAATCTTDGYTTQKCQNSGCTYSNTTTTKATGHNMKTTSTTAATCTTDGYTTQKCQNSGCTYSTTTKKAKLGHNWNIQGYQEYVADGECTKCADYRTSHRHIIKYECSRCGQKENYAQGHYPKFTYVWDWDGLNVPYFMCVCGRYVYYGDESFFVDFFDFWCTVSSMMYVKDGKFDRNVYDSAAAEGWNGYWSKYCDGTVGRRYNYS